MIGGCLHAASPAKNIGIENLFFLLLDLVLSQTLALFGTPEPQFVNVRLTDGQVGEVGQVGHTAEKQDSCERTKIFFFPLCRPTLSTSVCRSESWNCLSPSVYLFFFLSCFNLLKKCYTSQRRHLVLLLWWFTVGVRVVPCSVDFGLQTSDFLTCKQMFVKIFQSCFHLNVTTNRTAVAQSVSATQNVMVYISVICNTEYILK